MASPHDRFAALLPGHLADVLGEADARWLEQHRAGCAACAGLLVRLEARVTELRDEAGHAPVSVLEDLVAKPSPLTPLEIRLVELHLAACSTCLAEARALGYTNANLPRGGARSVVRLLRDWRVLLPAAALVLVLAIRHDWSSEEGPRSPIPVPAVPSTPAAVPVPRIPTLTFPETTRGIPASVVVDSVDRITPSIDVVLPVLFMADSSGMELSVFSHDRGVILRRDLSVRELSEPIRLEAPDSTWAPGRYRLRLTPASSHDTLAMREFEFTLRRRPDTGH